MESNFMEQPTLFAGDTHASPFQLQEKDRLRLTKDTSGQKCLELYKVSGRDGSLPKMLLDILNSVSTKLPHRWSLRASPSGRLLFQLVPLTPLTDETECGLLPTPNSQGGATVRNQTRQENGSQEHIQTTLYHYGLLPTIGANENKGSSKKRFKGSADFRGAKMSEGLRTTLEDHIYLNPSFAGLGIGYPKDYTLLEIPSSPQSPTSSAKQ